MDSEKHDSDDQVVVGDDNESPPQDRVKRHDSEQGRLHGHFRNGNAPPRRNNRSTESAQDSPVIDPWLLRIYNKVLSPVSQQSSSNTEDKRKHEEPDQTLLDIQEPQEWSHDVDKLQVSQHQMNELGHQFQNILQSKENEWMTREMISKDKSTKPNNTPWKGTRCFKP